MKIFYQLLLSGLLMGLAPVLNAQDLTVTVTDANGAVGTEVCVDIIGENFTAISGMQFTISYDSDVLTFVSASGNINGTVVSMIQPSSRPGEIRVSWNLFSTTGYTDAGPFNIGQVCFTVEQATETLVQITDNPIPTEFTNDNNEVIQDVMINNGTINEGLGNMPNCMDGIMNGDETGVDCGGSCDPCPTCDDGIQNGDETGVDCGGSCAACPATCDDGIQNGDETGVDCGGSCDPCPTCDDGIQNGNETGVDCGGSCTACPPTCDDGIMNGDETGVDCGGSCNPCPATCDDGIQNGNETGIDCGGSCDPCPGGGGGPDTGCGNGTSALSLCLGDVCDVAMNEPFCIDITAGNFTNVTGFQTDVTFPAGSLLYQSATTVAALGDPIQVNVVNATTLRLLYFQQSQSGVTVANGTIIGSLCFTNQTTNATTLEFEDLVVTGTNGQVPNPVGNSGSVNDCTGNMPTCNDNIQNGNETGVDCGGSCTPCNDTGGPDLDCGSGTSAFSLCLGDACNVAANANVCIDITAGNFTNITGFQTDVTFNSGQLTYESITQNAALGDPIQVNNVDNGTLRLLYFQQAQSGVTVTNGTIIGTLCFTNNTTNTTILNFEDLVVTGTNGQVPNPVGNGGSVNDCTGSTPTCNDGIQNGDETGVDCGGSCAACPTTDCGEGTTDVEVCIGSACADAGAEVCVPVFVGNFTSLAGLQFQLDYTGANLDFTRVIAADALASGTAPGNPSDGRLNVVWNDASGAGVNFPADEVAFELCFTVENATATPITFFNESTTLRAFNELGTRLPSSGNPGAANSNCGGTPTCNDGVQNGDETGVDCGGSCDPCGNGGGPDTDCGMGTSAFSLCAGEYCNIAPGSEVCIGLTAGNFTNITAFQTDMIFNAGQLTFQSLMTNNALGDPIQASTPSAGVLRLLYFQQAQSGATVTDGTVIATICFTNNTNDVTTLGFDDLVVTGTNGQVPNPVGNDGSINDCTATTPTCSDGIQNGNETGVDCGGSCDPCPGGGGGPDLSCGDGTSNVSLCLGDYCDIAVGAEVCVEITAGNFSNVTGFQTDINFPASQLTYTRATTAAVLGDQLLVNPISGGVRVLYFQQAQSGVTVDDGTIIGSVCFTNNSTSTTVLSFSDLVVTGTNGQQPNPVGNGGTVNDCTTGDTCSNGVQDGDETGVDCGGSCAACPTTNPLVINVPDGSVAVDEEVCINVSVTDFTNITDVSLTLNYDDSALMLFSVTANTALPGFGAGNFTTNTPGEIGVTYSTTTPRSLGNGSTLFTVCFTAREAGDTDLTISNASATINGNESLPVNTNSGTITVTGQVSFDNLTVVTGNANGAEGTEVCLDYRVYNFENLAGMQFPITYDAEKLSFESAEGTGALPGLQAFSPDPGIVRVIWFDPSVQPNSLDDGTSILTVCFTVLSGCETEVEIEEIPRFSIRAINPENQPINPFDVVSGTVNEGVTGTDCGPPPASNLVIDLTNAEGPIGTEVCMNLRVTDFVQMTNLSFTLNYDADVVSFARVNNFGLTSVTASDVTHPTPGVLTFDWDAAGGSGQSLADDATLLSFCFTVDRVATTNVNFANSPTIIRARNASGQNIGVVPDGGIINPNVPVTDGLTFQIGSTMANTGDNICLPVIGYEVNDLIAFQYTINYPDNLLRYTGTQGDFALSGAVSINQSDPGVLRILWADGNANGNTVPDGTAIFYICFEVLDDDPAIVSFGNTPTAIEFEDVNSIVNADLLNGQVNGSMAPSIVDADLDPPTCSNGSDGSITLTVSGGPNLTYMWSGNVSMSNVASNLTAGMYSVTVTNPAGQSTSATYNLENPAPLQLAMEDFPNPTVSGVTCNGEADGSISIVVEGGVMPYSYDWSGSLPDNVSSQNNLDGGSYNVTVTDANGCELPLENIMVGEPGEILIGGTPIKIGESAPGGVNVVIQGGRAPFSYAWTGPDNYTADTEDINDVTTPGTYCLTATDNNDCVKTQCFSVIEDIRYGIVVENGCTGENNGSITLTVSGATGNYDYVWTGPNDFTANTRDISSLVPGDYNVVITSGPCESTAAISIEPEEILAPATVTPSTAGNNGTITLTPSGGNPPFSFAWADGPTTQNRTDLASGEYCVTITDESNCEKEFCYTVGAADISFGNNSTRPATCPDAEDGVIRLLINNGTRPFTIQVEPLGTQVVADTNIVEISVPAGTYDVSVTDSQGGRIETELTVDGPVAITATPTIISNTEDTGCSGMISLEIEGGSSPYTVAWSNQTSGPSISQLCMGTYSATVTDDNGCTFETELFTIARIDEALDSITLVACEDGMNGEIFVTISGGVEPYTYSWTRTGEMEELGTDEDLIGIGAGDFTLTVMDATGATLIKNYNVGNTAGFSVSASVTTDYGGFGASCPDASDAQLVATISGQGEFFYEWTRDDASVAGTTAAIDNQPPGTYTLVVSDNAGCEITQTITVTAPPPITLEEEITRISCGSTDDGAISVTPSGGVGAYSFSWSTNSTASQIQGLGTGDYSLTVTDGNQCVSIASYSLAAPEDLAITFEATAADDGCNGSIRILPLGGSGNYIFNWPQLPNQGNDAFAEGLCPGEYTLEVTDDNGCQTVMMVATVLDRRLPCLSTREVLTPNGDGLNETLVIFCSGDEVATNNTLEVYNRWGQLVYEVEDYDCSADDGLKCFDGRTNDGSQLPAGPYYYIFEFTTAMGPRMQQRGSFTILRD